MKPVLIVIDMQKDFIDGALGTKEACSIVPKVVDKITYYIDNGYDIIYTQDTHNEDYLSTMEGMNLPVIHCVKGTLGWMMDERILPLTKGQRIFEKPTFGSTDLAKFLSDNHCNTIELVGLCTDICVISNAIMIKAFLPEAKITVDSACCAGVSPDSHNTALESMKMCHINIT